MVLHARSERRSEVFSLCKAACHDKFLALAPWRWLDMGRKLEGDRMDMEGC